MDTKKLKQKVLDLAIRGKLVPQDPNDEPAYKLLERIQAEKQKLIAEGKIKKEKRTSFIFKGEDNSYYEKVVENGKETTRNIDAEIPFDIPESWAWTRFGNICIINPKNIAIDSLEVSFVPMNKIQDGMCNKFSFDIRPWKDIKNGYTHFADGDIGFAKITPCFENKKSVIFSNLKNGIGAGTTELFILRPYVKKISRTFILYFIKRDEFISNGIRCYKGAVGQQRVSCEFVRNTLLPLPPIGEQKSIVEAIESLTKFIALIDDEYSSLSEKIALAKSKLLDLAIRGKLLPQDPNDEPASVLLDRIRKEKESSNKTTKGKRKSADSYIFKGEDNLYYEQIGSEKHCIQDEIPFDIPGTWAWVRFEYACVIISTRQRQIKESDILNEGTIPVITQSSNFIEGYFKESEHTIKIKKPLILFGDHTLNVKYIDFDFVVGADGIKILDAKFFDPLYFYYCVLWGAKQIKNRGYSRHFQFLKNLLIPFPPLEEQKRIIEFLRSTFILLDSLVQH